MANFLAPTAIASASAKPAGAATIAKNNYADALRKSLDTNKALNPYANKPSPTSVGMATQSSAAAGTSSGVVQQQQLKNLAGQQADRNTTNLIQQGANKTKEVVQADAQQRQDEVGFSDATAQNAAQTYNVGDANGARQHVVQQALGLVGTGYAYGGGGYGIRSSRGHGLGTDNVIGVDCSGLTSYAYGTIGIHLARQSDAQLRSSGYKTQVSNLRPGDLVGWARGGHVAMYIGNGQIVESPHPGARVRVRTLGSGDSKAGVYGVALKIAGDK